MKILQPFSHQENVLSSSALQSLATLSSRKRLQLLTESDSLPIDKLVHSPKHSLRLMSARPGKPNQQHENRAKLSAHDRILSAKMSLQQSDDTFGSASTIEVQSPFSQLEGIARSPADTINVVNLDLLESAQVFTTSHSKKFACKHTKSRHSRMCQTMDFTHQPQIRSR